MGTRSKVLILTFCLLTGGFAGGFWYAKGTDNAGLGSKQVRSNEGALTNPLLECEVAAGAIDSEKINFQAPLGDFVENIEKRYEVSHVAVYFRDLNNGPTFGINYNDPFIPASLLKMPLMMAYYKLAELNPKILNDKITASQTETDYVAKQQVPPNETLTAGKEYGINELIEKMIRYSDNASTVMLFERVPPKTLLNLYQLLGVDASVLTEKMATLSVKQYAAFFRILFNASYLSQENSERALTLLTETTYDRALAAGVPKTIKVAHKFGERLISALGEQHVHDCGIIYYPKHPYLLCIMSRGQGLEAQQAAIRDISAFVYEKINTQYADR